MMEEWLQIRERVLREGVSKRQILRETGMHWTTLERILSHPIPPGYCRKQPISNKIDPYLEQIRKISSLFTSIFSWRTYNCSTTKHPIISPDRKEQNFLNSAIRRN